MPPGVSPQCPDYLLAEQCPGANITGPDLYVCASIKGGPAIFDGWAGFQFYVDGDQNKRLCYRINHNGTTVCLPPGAIVVAPSCYTNPANHTIWFTDPTTGAADACVGCANAPTPVPPSGPGTGGQTGGGGDGNGTGTNGGGGGLDNGSGNGGANLTFWATTPCADTPANPPTVYADTATSTPLSGAGTGGLVVFAYGVWCYSYDPTSTPVPQASVPLGALTLSVTSTYADCATCVNGIPCGVCGNQDLPAVVPKLYAHTAYSTIITSPVVFERGGICYRFDPAVPAVPKPADGVWVNPSSDFSTCADCNKGILAVLCDPTQTGPALWVRANKIGWTGTIIDRAYGLCYQLNAAATQVGRPWYAVDYTPAGHFAGSTACADCLCGEPTELTGRNWRFCPAWGITPTPDPWTPLAWLPAGPVVMRINGICRWLYPNDPIGRIPVGAILINPRADYPYCTDCVNAGPVPPDPPPPPVPPSPPPCPPGQTFNPVTQQCEPTNGCPPGTYWDPISQTCLSVCQGGYAWDPTANQCLPIVPPCPPGQTWNPTTQQCEPTGGCPVDTYWDPVAGRCVPRCALGTSWDPTANICVPMVEPCPPGQVWDPLTHACVDAALCPPGLVWDPRARQCVTYCPPGQVWDNQLRRCVPGGIITPPPFPPPPPPPVPPPGTPPPPPPGPQYYDLQDCNTGTLLGAHVPNMSTLVASIGGNCYKPVTSTTATPATSADAFFYSCGQCSPAGKRCVDVWTADCANNTVNHSSQTCVDPATLGQPLNSWYWDTAQWIFNQVGGVCGVLADCPSPGTPPVFNDQSASTADVTYSFNPADEPLPFTEVPSSGTITGLVNVSANTYEKTVGTVTYQLLMDDSADPGPCNGQLFISGSVTGEQAFNIDPVYFSPDGTGITASATGLNSQLSKPPNLPTTSNSFALTAHVHNVCCHAFF